MPKKQTVFEIGKKHIAMAEAEITANGAIITYFETRDFNEAVGDDEFIRALKEITAQHPVASRTVNLLIGRDLATVRYLKLPTTSTEELVGMVELQATRQLPFNRDDIIYSSQVIESSQDGSTKLLLAIVHRNVIERSIKLLSLAGLKAQSIDISSNAISELLNREKPVLFLGLAPETTEFLVSSNGNLLFSRSIRIGRNKVAEESSLLTDEINNSLNAFAKSEFYTVVESYIKLDNEIPPPPNLVEEKFNLDVKLFKDPALFDEYNKSAHKISLLGLFGKLASKKKDIINLLSQKTRTTQKKETSRQQYVVNAVLILLISSLVALGFYLEYNRRVSLMKELDSKYLEIKPEARRIEESRKKLSLIKEQLDFKGSSLDMLRVVYDKLPTDSYLMSFDFRANESLSLQGLSTGMKQVFDFVKALKEYDEFSEVELRYTTKRKTEEAEFFDFQIWCKLE